MAVFSWTHDWDASLDEEPATLRAEFGDGYAQVVAAGINCNPRKWAITFNNREEAEINKIVAFLRANYLGFDWTDPDGQPGRWECKSWQSVRQKALLKSLSADFEEVFGR
ncbi:MAG: phage tail protein [Zoogloeaceae bacterium]|jgi:phage-related protein|nr:phage tail protein [Zoogloeaceae bacterium]